MSGSGPGAHAWLIGTDTHNGGNWKGRYGTEGYILPSHHSTGDHDILQPDYVANFAFDENTSQWIWDATAADERAAQSTRRGRVASVAIGNDWSFSLRTSGTRPYALTLYLLDFDSYDRAQDVSLHDVDTGALLDQRRFERFHGGTYVTYEVTGSIRVRFQTVEGNNAVLAGIFFDSVPSDRLAALADMLSNGGAGAVGRTAYTVSRQSEILRYTITHPAPEQPDAEQAPEGAARGLSVRYFVTKGYNDLVREAQTDTVSGDWWSESGDGFPGLVADQPGHAAWAEWSGILRVPPPQHENTIRLGDDGGHGMRFAQTGAGLCVTSVEAGSPAAEAGILPGDVFVEAVPSDVPILTKVQIKLQAPLGGHLYLDGVRALHYTPCGEDGITDCSNWPDLEAALQLAPGAHRLRIAAVRAWRDDDGAGRGLTGPLLQWRFADDEEWREIPGEAFSREAGAEWRREPRQAAQVGLEWLQTAARDWQRTHNCYGCHVQAQAVLAGSIARDNGYVVSGPVMDELMGGLVGQQNDDGSWHDGQHITATHFAAMALAMAKERTGVAPEQTLADALDYLLTVQAEYGYLPADHNEPPVSQGEIIAAANARSAFELGARWTSGERSVQLAHAADAAQGRLRASVPVTNQDHALRLLGLANAAWRDADGVNPALESAVEDLLMRRNEDGGWSEIDGLASNAYATGQALYALRVAGFDTDSEIYQRGMDWLLTRQYWSGAWAQRDTTSHHFSQFAATMWPVIALLNSYPAVVLSVSDPGCMDGPGTLSADLAAGVGVNALRFLVDGVLVGSVPVGGEGSTYEIAWDAGDVEVGRHMLSVEAVRDGRPVRTHDVRFITMSPGASCTGTFQVVAGGGAGGGTALPSHIALIVDASNSMWGRLPGDIPKISAAKEVLNSVLDDLPVDVQVALRVYGHRVSSKDKARSCEDSELLVPFGADNRPALRAAIDALTPRGYTPIGLSLRALEGDLAGAEGHKVVVVVTDGIETCDPEPGDANFPPAVVEGLVASGVDVTVNVIGFDITESATRAFLTTISDAGGGIYIDAADAGQLLEALQETIVTDFILIDADDKVAAQGQVGDAPVTLEAGSYRLVIGGANAPTVAIEITPGRDTVHTLN